MIGVCVECGKRFEIDENENLSDYQCSCGGRLLKGLEDLRNNLAHAQDIIMDDWPKV